jgi:bacterioferritin
MLEKVMAKKKVDTSNSPVIKALNAILELELSGVVRYTHYALMVFGYNRIPIVSWLRGQATESLDHANKAGELITNLGAHPSLAIGALLETHNHDVGGILRESQEHENATLMAYRKLLKLVDGKSIMLEEYAREMIYAEEMHLGEVDKMLRKPGDVGVFQS